MKFLDILCVIFLFVGVLNGARYGFIKTLFSIISLVISSFIAGKFYMYVSHYLPKNEWNLFFSFTIVFIIVAFIIGFIGNFLSEKFTKIVLNPTDRIVGAFFGLIISIFFIGIIYNFCLKIYPSIGHIHTKILSYVLEYYSVLISFLPLKIIKLF